MVDAAATIRGSSYLCPSALLNSDKPPKHLYTEMYTADWWWETQVKRDTPG
jgi:hypothetical protein